MAFHTNILSAVNCFHSLDDMFNGPEAADELVGKPDFVCMDPQGNQLLMTIEIRTEWVLDGSDIRGKIQQTPPKILHKEGS